MQRGAIPEILRQHQFNKVELVSYTSPEQSIEELERLTGNAEQILKELGLPYRGGNALATGDLGFAPQKPTIWKYGFHPKSTIEKSPAARIVAIFKQGDRKFVFGRRRRSQKEKAKPRLVHHLNGSGLAVGLPFSRSWRTTKKPMVLSPFPKHCAHFLAQIASRLPAPPKKRFFPYIDRHIVGLAQNAQTPGLIRKSNRAPRLVCLYQSFIRQGAEAPIPQPLAKA